MKYFLLLIVIVSSYFGYTQNTIPYLDEDIKIDGRPDEQVWSDLTVFSGFEEFIPMDGLKAEHQTEVKIFHNKQSLFVFATYYDVEETSVVSTLKRDNHYDTVVRSDAFGFAIDPTNQKNSGYYFAVNDGNNQVDALLNYTGGDYDFNTSWNAVWKSGTSKEGIKKMYEFEIPLKSLSFNQNQNEWGLIFFKRDFKALKWSAYSSGLTRNSYQFDLRFSVPFQVKELPKVTLSKLTLIPSLTTTINKNVENDDTDESLTPSLDVQYNVTPSLKLDATINPDFSQVDVDAPVTNLTRFAVNFPEQRNFFIENSDLFNSLGNSEVNPFYSRRIGAETDMLYGLKLSGSVAPKTRIGFLNSQTKENEKLEGQNYTVGVVQQQINDQFTASTYLVNQQDIENIKLGDSYNRVAGANVNFKTKDAKYSAKADYGLSLSNDINSKNNFYNIEGQYLVSTTRVNMSYSKTQRSFITKAGFNPRIYNYDALTRETTRQDYQNLLIHLQHSSYPEKGKVQRYRWANIKSNTYFNQAGEISEAYLFWGHSIWFRKNQSALYIYPSYWYDNLSVSFDVLNNGNPIKPGKYDMPYLFGGYNNQNSTSDLYYGFSGDYGKFYNGTKASLNTKIGYRFMPMGKIEVEYNPTHINLNEFGKDTYHTVKSGAELFFSNRMNWSTYIQYNAQRENFNINSRFQWEYKPLSYLYVVFTDNLRNDFQQKNYGVAVKANYRLNL